jgi:hypothetical protein
VLLRKLPALACSPLRASENVSQVQPSFCVWLTVKPSGSIETKDASWEVAPFHCQYRVAVVDCARWVKAGGAASAEKTELDHWLPEASMTPSTTLPVPTLPGAVTSVSAWMTTSGLKPTPVTD